MKTTRAELKARARQALKGNYSVMAGGVLLYYGVSYVLSMAMQLIMTLATGSTTAFTMLASHAVTDREIMAGGPVGVVLIVAAAVVMYLVMIVIIYLLLPGLVKMNMNLCQGQKANVSDLFWAFHNRPWKFVGIGVIFFFGILILMIPIIILSAAAVISGETGFMVVFIIVYTVILMAAMIYFALTFAMFYYILVEDPEKGIFQALRESRSLMIGNRWRYFVFGLSWLGWECLLMFSFGIGYLWLLPYIYCAAIFFYYDLKPQTEAIVQEQAWEPYTSAYGTPEHNPNEQMLTMQQEAETDSQVSGMQQEPRIQWSEEQPRQD